MPLNKRRHRRLFRRRSPAQHVRFLEFASTLNIELDNEDVQLNFDTMYAIMLNLLDRFYPEREITVTSSDPPYVTPAVKAQLRRRNRLMRAGRTAEVDGIAARIRTAITRNSTRWLRKTDARKSPKETWAKVSEVIKGKGNRTYDQVDGLTVQIFNDHYAAISTDTDYSAPTRKLTAPDDCCYVSENGCVSDVGHPTSNSDGPRSDTGMVLATWCADFRRTASPSVPSVARNGRRTAPVEDRRHKANTKDRRANAAE